MKNLTVGPYSRLLLLGGGELLVEIGQWAKQIGYEVAVITSPRHASSILPTSKRSLQDLLKSLNILTHVVEDLNSIEAKAAIGSETVVRRTFALSIGAAWIFKKAYIDAYLGGLLFNLHGTRLPQNRGGGGFSWQILTGNRFGFCTLHLIDDGIDTGDIVSYEEFIYPPCCRTPADFGKHYKERNFDFLVSLLSTLREQAKDFAIISQPEYLSTYWPRLNSPEQAWIDWGLSPEQLERFICAFDEPYCGAQTTWRNRIVRVRRAFANHQDGEFHPFQAGFVYRNNGKWLCVACDGGAIVIETLIDEDGNNVLPTIRVGDAFHTPGDLLAHRTRRVIYGPNGLINSKPSL